MSNLRVQFCFWAMVVASLLCLTVDAGPAALVAKPLAKQAGKQASKEIAGQTAGKTASKVAGKAAGQVAGKTAGQAAGKVAGQVAGKTAGQATTTVGTIVVRESAAQGVKRGWLEVLGSNGHKIGLGGAFAALGMGGRKAAIKHAEGRVENEMTWIKNNPGKPLPGGVTTTITDGVVRVVSPIAWFVGGAIMLKMLLAFLWEKRAEKVRVARGGEAGEAEVVDAK